MSRILAIARKEVLDNVRDRRTLLSALLFGPLFGPLMFTAMINIVVGRTVTSAEEALTLPIVGIETAQNLDEFLRTQRIEADAGTTIDSLESAAAAVRTGLESVVLVIDPTFASDFGTARAGRVTVVVDRSSSADGRSWKAA